jgi:hypothetical protein
MRGVGAFAALLAISGGLGCAAWQSLSEAVRFAGEGRVVDLREEATLPSASPDASPDPRPGVLLIAIDGVDRDLLYDMLREGDLPRIADALGFAAEGGHAHLEPSLVSSLPSSTAVAWATVLTGVDPGRHGIVGNEFFLRDERRLVAPVPSSIQDPSDVLATYADGLVNDLLLSPTVYEQIRATEPDVRIWVGMHSVFKGADLLLMPDLVSLLDAFRVMVQERLRATLTESDAFDVYEKLDRDIVESVRRQLEEEEAPDVLTVYLPGNDLWAHTAEEGPDQGRRHYLHEVVDPLVGDLIDDLREHDAFDDRWTVITSDHGHTRVAHRDHQSLGVDDEGEPAQVLERAGFTMRPFTLATDDDADDFDAVITYQGGLAYVYVADRSTCVEREARCDWEKPPRFREDVLAAADAFHRTNEDGLHASELIGSLEMVLVRDPDPVEGSLGFHVYAGDGRLETVEAHLAAHPRPNWVDFEARLHALCDGPGCDRVGDLVLIARAGDEWALTERRYFAPPYRSYHGSPSAKDSRVPLVVAHPRRSAEETRRLVERVLSGHTAQSEVAHLLLVLRGDAPEPRTARSDPPSRK